MARKSKNRFCHIVATAMAGAMIFGVSCSTEQVAQVAAGLSEVLVDDDDASFTDWLTSEVEGDDDVSFSDWLSSEVDDW